MMSVIFPAQYAVFDTETTGLDVNTARIVELAVKVVKFDAGGVKRETAKSWLVFQDAPLPEVITELTGITNEMVSQHGVPLAKALSEFQEMVGRLPLVGHNVTRYDCPLMLLETQRAFGSAPASFGPVIDTAALFKARMMGTSQLWNESHCDMAGRVLSFRVYGLKYNLTFACDKMGISRNDLEAHRASGDVEMADRLFRALCA